MSQVPGGVLLDARDAFAARAREGVVKFPAASPNMRFLKDLCSGLAKVSTDRLPLPTSMGPSPAAAALIGDAVSRNVHGVASCEVTACGTGWLVVFEARDDHGDPFTYSFTIGARWIATRENQG